MPPIVRLGEQQRELISIGASSGGNCLPCLRHHFAEAVKAGCTLEEIEEAVELSRAVKERPIKDIYRLGGDLLRTKQYLARRQATQAIDSRDFRERFQFPVALMPIFVREIKGLAMVAPAADELLTQLQTTTVTQLTVSTLVEGALRE